MNGSPQQERPQTLEDLITEADSIRNTLQACQSRLGRLIAALRQQRRQARAVRAAVASLRQLPTLNPRPKEKFPMFRNDLLTDPGGTSLAGRLQRLRESLEDLIVRLEEGIAVAVSDSAAEAIRDAVLAVLARVIPSRARVVRPPPPGAMRPPWDEPERKDDYHWFREPADDEWPETREPVEAKPPVVQQPNQTPSS